MTRLGDPDKAGRCFNRLAAGKRRPIVFRDLLAPPTEKLRKQDGVATAAVVWK